MLKNFRYFVLTGLLAFTGSSAYAQQLMWSDEFDSGTAPDPATWSYDLGGGGWGNNELQEYTDDSDNVRIENGNLVINVEEISFGANGRAFTSARVKTEDKLVFRYGTIEARIKIPDLSDGLWPAFWTLGNNFSQVGWPSCGELDVMEMGSAAAISAGTINRYVTSTAHWENDGTHAEFGSPYTAPADLDDDYHLYRMEWTPEFVATYLDGERIWAINIEPDSCTDCTEFHEPHFMILNVAVGGNYTGLLSSDQITAGLPAEMMVDYVRIYNNGYTEVNGETAPEDTVVGLEYSGSWYNADQDGHGFSMEFGELPDGSPLAVVYWYTYDSLGNPIFMVGSGTPTEDRVEIALKSPVGMQYGVFDPTSVLREDGGTAVFEFSDADNGTFNYTPSDFSVGAWGHTPIVDLPIVKLFAIPVSESGGTVQ
jgi:beta-glucanase (GH16 family)